ncbi:unnamed protein product [Arctia plantaginis]|uniref:Uncharacterized protein n=1 Tax=Arctia plantaginis TaxID=874455 RepID=A0A8S0Z7K0_ARCPL|nr:unnamed protein product [Arctia plantaginis]
MCLPLRYGLITWGYFRLILAGIILLGASLSVHRRLRTTVDRREEYNVFNSFNIIILSIVILMVVADIILGVIFIVSCHKKNVKLISKYYHYTIVLLAIFIPLSLYCGCAALYHMYTTKPPLSFILAFVLLDLFSLFVYIVIQIYAVLLIRSEIIKLKNNGQFRFENKAAEAECYLRIDNSIGQNKREDETEKNDIGVITAEV